MSEPPHSKWHSRVWVRAGASVQQSRAAVRGFWNEPHSTVTTGKTKKSTRGAGSANAGQRARDLRKAAGESEETASCSDPENSFSAAEVLTKKIW